MWIAEPGKEFTTKKGYKLYTLSDLLLWLSFCSEDEFKFHVNEEKNDIANWIRDVFSLTDLANDLYSVKTKEDTMEIIKNFLDTIKPEKRSEEEVLGEFLHELKHGI